MGGNSALAAADYGDDHYDHYNGRYYCCYDRQIWSLGFHCDHQKQHAAADVVDIVAAAFVAD